MLNFKNFEIIPYDTPVFFKIVYQEGGYGTRIQEKIGVTKFQAAILQ